LSANEPQTLGNEYSCANKILDAECKQTPAILDDVIKTCEYLHEEEQHQLKKILQTCQHLFDGLLGEILKLVNLSIIVIIHIIWYVNGIVSCFSKFWNINFIYVHTTYENIVFTSGHHLVQISVIDANTKNNDFWYLSLV
jgi:hypothetical protein